MARITVSVSAELEAKIDQLAKELGSRAAVLLAALATYRTDVALGKPAPKKKKKPTAEPKIGTGNRPKNIEEVKEFFASRGVPEPLADKAREFFDFYESRGWRTTAGPLANWGSCLTTFQKNNAHWRPVPEAKRDTISVDDFLGWIKAERPSWLKLFRDIQRLDEVDEFYLEEYRANN